MKITDKTMHQINQILKDFSQRRQDFRAIIASIGDTSIPVAIQTQLKKGSYIKEKYNFIYSNFTPHLRTFPFTITIGEKIALSVNSILFYKKQGNKKKVLELCALVGPHDWNIWENKPYENVIGGINDSYSRYCKRCGAIEYSKEKPDGEIEEHPLDTGL